MEFMLDVLRLWIRDPPAFEAVHSIGASLSQIDVCVPPSGRFECGSSWLTIDKHLACVLSILH